jgi:hypothetical protein
MRIFEHRTTKQIYGRTSDGQVYQLDGRAQWCWAPHPPTTDMFELQQREFPVLFQSLEERVER